MLINKNKLNLTKLINNVSKIKNNINFEDINENNECLKSHPAYVGLTMSNGHLGKGVVFTLINCIN